MSAARKRVMVLALWTLLAAPLAAQTEIEVDPGVVPASAAQAEPVAAPIPAEQPDATLVESPAPATSSEMPVDEQIAETPPPAPDAGADAERVALKAYVDGVLSSLQREHGLAAVTLAVVKDDALWLAQGYGQADLASARPVIADTTLFRIGSVSKTFIWTAVMLLVERGQIDLDADLNSYLKTVRIGEAFGTPVTMRQLMHHRAGFEDSMRLFAVGDDDPRTLAEVLAEQQPKRVYAPGLRTSYSNWGAALAAQVVADVSGKDYGDFLRGEILDPLGMHATTWIAPAKLDAAQRANLATGYKKDQGALGL